jgi:oligosaccharide repeat unit polymerase
MISIFLITLNVLAVMVFSLVRARRHPFILLDPAWAFLGGYAINYCIRPILFLFDPSVGGIYQDDIYPEAMIRHGVNTALLFALLGLAGFAVGDFFFERTARKMCDRLPTLPFREFAERGTYSFLALFFLVLGGLGFYGFVSSAGWAGTLLELFSGGQRDAFMQVILGHGYYTFAMQLSLLGWVMICAKWIAFPRLRSGLGRVGHALVRYSWFFCTILIWLGLGERASIVTVLFVPIALYFTISSANSEATRQRRRNAIILTVGAVIVFTCVAGPIGLLMKGKEVSVTGMAAMAISAWDSFEFTIAAQNYVHFSDLFWGRTYVSDLVYTWLPRVVFPWKPERYGAVLVQDKLAPDFVNNVGATFPTGFLVEAYANFWYFGVFIVPMVLAVISKALYYRLLKKYDWFWLVQMALLFPLIASFRSVGWTAAALLANIAVTGFVALVCYGMKRINMTLRSLPLDLSSPSRPALG